MKKFLISGMLVLLPALTTQPAWAEGEGGAYFLAGSDVVEHCTGQTGAGAAQDAAFCQGFIAGVADFYMQNGTLKGCFLQSGVTMQQMADKVTMWLHDNPTRRRGSAVAAIGTALEESFPCGK